VDICSS